MPGQPIDALTRLGNGQRIDHLARSLWDQARSDGTVFGDPLDPPAADAFIAWIHGPAEHGASRGVNRYLYAAYLTRPDLQEAFPDLDGQDGTRLVRWAQSAGGRDVLVELSGAATPLTVNVIGFLGEALGLGEAARLYVAGLEAAHVGVSTTAVALSGAGKPRSHARRDGARAYRDLSAPAPPQFNLACVNADFLAGLVAERGADFLAGLPTIGQWGFETDVLPPSWAPAFPLVDEVWVYSRFVAENLGRLLPVPVVVVPPAVIAPARGDRLDIANDDRFTFLTMFDLFSTVQRKNPGGVIDAFKRAFDRDEGPRLIVKTLNAAQRPEAVRALRAQAEGRPDIEFVDAYLTPEENGRLMDRADCFVSLHRSEGFGLGLAESMALGTPVIATGYSGNMDFTSPANSWLVDWHPTRVGPDVEVYPPEGRWADPDIAHAGEQLRRVWSQPDVAAVRAERGRQDIARLYAPEVTGLIARERLELLRDQQARRQGKGGWSARHPALADGRRLAGDAYRRVLARARSAQ